jgi:hypothetical protein
MIDLKPAYDKIDIAPQFKKAYEKTLLNGLTIMFNSKTHKMMVDQIEKPGDLAKNISDGVVALFYLIWNQTNKSIAPQIIVPVVFTWTLKTFDFLQMSNDPRATKKVLGDATDLAVTTIMQKFGVKQNDIEKLVRQNDATLKGVK